MTATRVIVGIYVFACAAALLVIPASLQGWFGLTPDPLSAVFAIVLAAPWSALLSRIEPPSMALATLCIALGMALNAAILWMLAHAMTRAVKSRFGR